MQNNRHQLEIFLPNALERHGEGWKLTVRVRLVHAQIRQLVRAQADWDVKAWGMPISAAHLALANTCFSTRVLKHVKNLLNIRLNVKQRRSFLHTWHYVGYLMGVPEALLTSNQKEIDELYKVALMCEPPPSNESIVMANALINSSAKISKLGDQEGKQLIHNVYKVSRALVGDKLADQLHYPPTKKFGVFSPVSHYREV